MEQAVEEKRTKVAGVLIGTLERALREFGTHAFDDRGPDEVLDMGKAAAAVRAQAWEDRGRSLGQLARHSERGMVLAGRILLEITEGEPEEAWPNAVAGMRAGAGETAEQIFDEAGLCPGEW